MPPDDDGWKEYQVHVLSELKRLTECYNRLEKKVGEIRTDIATLKVKAGIWGLAGGGTAVLVLIGIWIVKSL